MTKKDIKKKKLIKILIVFFVAGSILVISFITGFLSYGIGYMQCGQEPVEINGFGQSTSYRLPKDSGYGPSMLNSYVCTQTDAEASGSTHSMLR